MANETNTGKDSSSAEQWVEISVEIDQHLRKEYGMTIADILEIVRSPNSEK